MSESREQYCAAVVKAATYCGSPEVSMHHGVQYHQHHFQPPASIPLPHERVDATCVTTWTCHVCGREQDVSGEGAVGNWMDCGNPECGAASYLDLVP